MNAMVRTFRGPDARAALAAVKAELGPDAIVIDSREVSRGLLRGREVEVTAAMAPPEPEVPKAPPREYARPAPAPQPAMDAGLMQEVRALRRALADARREVMARTGDATAEAELLRSLIERGVDPELAEELVRAAIATSAPAARLDEAVRELVGERLVPARAPWTEPDRRVIALVGPTGVGKTTTIAKIAARALLESRRKIALVTVDTFRIGGAEQLGRYGKILGVGARVARDAAELRAEVERARDADLVLVDTAGRSDPEELAGQAELVRSVPGIALHLVVSAATGFRDLAAIGERYAALAPSRLVFTKVDEAAAPGAVLSVAARIGRPVACIACGQRVPEDLLEATPGALTDLVMGARSAGRRSESRGSGR